MTEPLTVTVLDPETMDELAPPCEAQRKPTSSPACDAAAEWAAVVKCNDCGTRYALYCDVHLADARNGRFWCRLCATPFRAIRVVAAERLS